MNIGIYGMHFKSAPLEIRERASFKASDLEKAYQDLLTTEGIRECVILSTCNRSQVIYSADEGIDGKKSLDYFYQVFFGFGKEEVEAYCQHEMPAVEHLFQTCCGLNSLVLGEDQILGQIKEAYYTARDFGATGKLLNRLFQDGITLGKKVKAETAISENPLSVASIAVKQGERVFGSLEGIRVMVLGRGEMSRAAIRHLMVKGVDHVYMATRSELITGIDECDRRRITRIPFDDRYEAAASVDWIISTTSAPHQVLEKSQFRKHHRGKKILITDIALPRDADPELAKLPGVSLYDLDQLEQVAKDSMDERSGKLRIIHAIIEEKVADYWNWHRCLPVYPRIQAIQQYSREMTEKEIQELFSKMPHLSEKDRQNIEAFIYSLVKKMWRTPIHQLKQEGLEGRGEEAGAFLDRLLACECWEMEENQEKDCREEQRQYE